MTKQQVKRKDLQTVKSKDIPLNKKLSEMWKLGYKEAEQRVVRKMKRENKHDATS